MKIWAKMILAAILLFILALISYVQTSDTSAGKKEELYRKGYLHFKRLDSLHLAMIDDTSGFYIDSLERLDEYYSRIIDSLDDFYSDREAAYLEAQKRLEAENKSMAVKSQRQTKTAPRKTKKVDTVRTKIKEDYRHMLADLPSDLTDYEKKVARNEIIVELSMKYKLPPESIRKYIK
jgi:hypothetical protein